MMQASVRRSLMAAVCLSVSGFPAAMAADAGATKAQRSEIADERRARAAPLPKPPESHMRSDVADEPLRRYWYDGKRRRTLRIDPEWIADFGPPSQPAATEAGKPEKAGPRVAARSPLQPAQPARSEGRASGPGVSEVLRNQAGTPRALPGGVIVRLHETDRRNAHQVLVDARLRPLRSLDAEQRNWLVESPPGLATLELANRLHESGRFESASPNWWRPRALK